MGSSPVSTVSRIFVEVLERNPRLPEVPNHRVLLRFEAAYAVRSDIRTHMLQTLSRKWLFLLTLDGYLRPECNGKPACDSLNVIWAKKSLVYLKEKGEVSSWPSDNARMRRQVNYEVAQRRSVRSSAAAVAGGVHLDQDLTCPWAELAKLTQRLLVDYGNGVQTLPELVNRFSAAGFGKLIEVKVEKLGPCALPQPFQVGKSVI
ncbi:unnamed protein product [Schistocephalus solidus]|uniref:Uncharacterized protein n=1 Tax=Schistocephalus solidus TaxID=70667 RepID=A0A183TDU1_SCHSO|nr:unnamed protein product [Schistocephalus solidus]